MKETIQSIIQWHTETFPDATLEGQRIKFWEEMEEFDSAPYYTERVTELVDMFIVACGVARFNMTEALSEFACVRERGNYKNIVWEDFEKVIDVKMQINRKRKWGCNKGYYRHIDE